MLADGKSTADMVEELHLSIHTVRNHIRNILAEAAVALAPRGGGRRHPPRSRPAPLSRAADPGRARPGAGQVREREDGVPVPVGGGPTGAPLEERRA